MAGKNPWDEIAVDLCFQDEKDMLTTLYAAGKTISEIAGLLDVGHATIQRRLALHGIKKRKRGGAQTPNNQMHKLFHVDQRIIIFYGLTHAAKTLRVSTATLYRYKRYKAGDVIRIITRKETAA